MKYLTNLTQKQNIDIATHLFAEACTWACTWKITSGLKPRVLLTAESLETKSLQLKKIIQRIMESYNEEWQTKGIYSPVVRYSSNKLFKSVQEDHDAGIYVDKPERFD